jgi:hypothetical protein
MQLYAIYTLQWNYGLLRAFLSCRSDSTAVLFHKCASVKILGLWMLADVLP